MLLPVSAALELVAFLMFFRAVSQHKPQDSGKSKFEPWIFVVIAGAIGLLVTLLLNLGACFWLSLRSSSPAFPQGFDQGFLMVAAWGFMVFFVWGFSAKWLPVFLGTHDPDTRLLAIAVASQVVAVAFGLAGFLRIATALLVFSSLLAIVALQIFSRPKQAAKTKGVHTSFPLFVRSAYVWLMIAALLGVWAANATNPSGIWGASRYALTVGFVAMIVFCVGQRVLPAFSGMRLLFSTKLMFAGLFLLTVGCALRVSSEVLAYQEIVSAAWKWLLYSAILELSAVTIFAINLVLTFIQKPVTQQLRAT